MAKIAGICYFKINGTQYSLRGGITISLSKEQGESVVGVDKYHGVKVMPKAAYIQCDLTDDNTDVDLNILNSLSDVTVTVELINGKTAVLRNATQVNPIELNPEESQYTVRFEGPEGEWLS